MTRWLVIGSGGIGPAHIQGLQSAPGAEVVGVVDPRFDRSTGEMARPPRFRDLTEALAEAQPDAAVIASPNDTHLDIGLACIAAGVHVLCEKPVGHSAGEARTLLSAAEQAGVHAGAVLNQRAQRHSGWVRQQIHSGALRVRSMTVTGQLGRLQGWHAEQDVAGGGVLRLIGIHFVDLARWWLGELELVGSLIRARASWEVDDVAHVMLRSADGVPATIALSATGEHPLGPVRIVLEGERVRVVVAGHEAIVVEGLEVPPPAEPSQPSLPYGPGHLAVGREANAALQAGRDFPVPLSDAVRTIELVDLAYATSNASSPMRPPKEAA